ncbi:hypothetical protein [Desulfurivibrio alkaliphilus]|uniref:Chemotaxis phosphatase CheX-like domain-containing protein n=1 Tax=Desulfurivibrio alkaliphilus (strain DSM 19089 / UNIQEM U267 / AHT2) TaxID=589865 RepID=D6Z1B9_DESAT|nr:hypothetical protein [Desulfurivibrio alkaliphilus]ADH85374.1 hypothetical protein DaAHT2_0670 [Desulfurivibrio alkaliphilus AHT 2]
MNETSAWDELLPKVMAEVMENTAFTEARPVAEAPCFDEGVRSVALLVHDPVQGEFRLLMAEPLVKHLAATVYGPVLEEIDEAIENDFLAELLNTIAGRLLGEMLPPECSFQLGLPESREGLAACSHPPCLSWHFTIEELNCTISLHGETLLALRRPPTPADDEAGYSFL